MNESNVKKIVYTQDIPIERFYYLYETSDVKGYKNDWNDTDINGRRQLSTWGDRRWINFNGDAL